MMVEHLAPYRGRLDIETYDEEQAQEDHTR